MNREEGVSDAGSVSSDGVRASYTNSSNKKLRFIRRYWYIVVAIVVIIAGLVGWRLYEMNVDATWNKATDYYGRADYANAAKLLNGMAVPSDEKRLVVYAQTMLATRQLDKALPAYRTLYDKKKDPAVKIIIGNIYNEQKKYDDAAKVYRDILNANSTYVQAYVNLSTLYKLQHKDQDAVDVAKLGIKANPNSATLYELLISMLLEKKDSPDYKRAVVQLKKLNPSDPLLESLKQ